MGKVAFGLACGVAVAWCAVATVLVGRRIRRRMKWWRLIRVVKDLEHGCESTVWTLRQVASAMTVEMRAGLATHSGSKLEMLVTFVDKLPNGYSMLHFILCNSHFSSFSFNNLINWASSFFFFFQLGFDSCDYIVCISPCHLICIPTCFYSICLLLSV